MVTGDERKIQLEGWKFGWKHWLAIGVLFVFAAWALADIVPELIKMWIR